MVERQPFEVVHGEAQVGVFGIRVGVGAAGFEAFGRAVKTLAECAMFVGVAEFAEQPARGVRATSCLFDQPQGGVRREEAGIRFFEHAAFEHAALPRAVGIDAAGAIRAKGGAWLGKAGDGRFSARNLHWQAEGFQLRRVIADLEFDEVEERAVAAHPASGAELFA
ncbi:MAG TPA: hypothetical protein VNR00_17135 [Opitutus sp.]|nr:hypothetical protein [Opitutus sp.]